MSEKLKTCAHCGCGGRYVCVQKCTAGSRWKGFWRVGCEACGLHAFYPSKEKAIRVWNTRTSHAAELAFIMGQIVSDLPTNRDWLDPDIEKAARAALAAYDQEGK